MRSSHVEPLLLFVIQKSLRNGRINHCPINMPIEIGMIIQESVMPKGEYVVKAASDGGTSSLSCVAMHH